MAYWKSGRDGEALNNRLNFEPKSDIEGRVDWAVAAITAHCLMTEALMHTICFDLADVSRTRLLNVLDIVHGQLEAGLGEEDETVRAFGEQRDSLRSLLVSSLIQAEQDLSLDR